MNRTHKAAKKPGANIARHPLHPVLVTFPIALLTFSFICDLLFRFRGESLWSEMAFYTMFGGVVGAVCAAIPGFIDYVALPRGHTPEGMRVNTIATSHMTLNLTVVLLYVVNLYLRSRSTPGAPLPFYFSVAGLMLLVVSGWLGGALVYVHGVGVDDARDVDIDDASDIESDRVPLRRQATFIERASDEHLAAPPTETIPPRRAAR